MDESVNPAWSARLRAAIARAAVAANETAAADISANADASAGVNANNSTTPSASVASSASASISSSTNSSARASAIAIASPSATTIRTGIAQLLPPPPALIAAHRAVKSPTELNAMRAAAKISADGMRNIPPSPSPSLILNVIHFRVCGRVHISMMMDSVFSKTKCLPCRTRDLIRVSFRFTNRISSVILHSFIHPHAHAVLPIRTTIAAFCDLMRRTHAGVSEDRLRHGGREEGEPFFEEFIMNFPFLDKIKIATNHF